ncbi:hypothetical protein RFI_29258 [Reticulomyxa filosa]|uniref:Uncharacterized protein n=1 Tax=Reticulomyxa filosa TaxID=46433 RepID=X6M3B4_RETFI|nr:hypothetical protein RFI_29258 [Reticulomyxa filosa]|eukprot:ETO08136.1 hypothetical protein RFI_29258 [Reticulomyxa filosa]
MLLSVDKKKNCTFYIYYPTDTQEQDKFLFCRIVSSTIITNCCHRQRLQIQYLKITNRHSSSEDIFAAETENEERLEKENDKDKVSLLELTKLEQLQEDKNVASDVKAEVQAIKKNEVKEEKTDAQVEALTKQEAVGARVKWEDIFGAIDFYGMNISLKHYSVHLILCINCSKKTKKYGAAIYKLTKGYSQKEVHEQVLLRLFDCFSIKDDLADMLLTRESMLKCADDALVTTIQSYFSDSKIRKRVKNK